MVLLRVAEVNDDATNSMDSLDDDRIANGDVPKHLVALGR